MKQVIFITLFCIMAAAVFAADSVSSVQEVGETRSYTLDGITYRVTVMVVSGDSSATAMTKLLINDVTTASLREGQSHAVSSSLTLTILDIRPTKSGDVSQNLVSFRLDSTPCGDGVCSSSETCAADSCCSGTRVGLASDNANCGACGTVCSSATMCISGSCQTYCGNSVCDDDEICKADSCCSGDETDFEDDDDNCGACGVECGADEQCVNAQCRTYCGNGVCESNEDSSCEDCPKEEASVKVEPKEEEQAEKVTLTKETPKESAPRVACDGCLAGKECVPEGTSGKRQGKEVYCDGSSWKTKKPLNAACSSSYECEISSCADGLCRVKAPPQTAQKKSFMNWLFSWFE